MDPKQHCIILLGLEKKLLHYQQQTAIFGSGLSGKAMQVTFKNWAYALANEPTTEGNPVYVWVDEQGGIWQPVGLNVQFVASSFSTSSSS